VNLRRVEMKLEEEHKQLLAERKQEAERQQALNDEISNLRANLHTMYVHLNCLHSLSLLLLLAPAPSPAYPIYLTCTHMYVHYLYLLTHTHTYRRRQHAKVDEETHDARLEFNKWHDQHLLLKERAEQVLDRLQNANKQRVAYHQEWQQHVDQLRNVQAQRDELLRENQAIQDAIKGAESNHAS
jgi:chromosome segregation ATPase